MAPKALSSISPKAISVQSNDDSSTMASKSLPPIAQKVPSIQFDQGSSTIAPNPLPPDTSKNAANTPKCAKDAWHLSHAATFDLGIRKIGKKNDQVLLLDESGNSPLHTLLSATFEQDDDLAKSHEICKHLADVTDFELTNGANKTVLTLGVASECQNKRGHFESLCEKQARTIKFARFLEIVAPNEGEWVEPWALGEHGFHAERISFQAWLETRATDLKAVEARQQAAASISQKKNQTTRELRWRTIDKMIDSLAGFSGPRFLTEYVQLISRNHDTIVGLKEQGALERPEKLKDFQWKQILKSFTNLILGGQDKMTYYFCLLASSERRTLLADYVFKKKLECGSFSQVNLCYNRHSGQDQRRAVKIVFPEGGEHGQHFKDAQKETDLQQRVSTSDYIVKIFAWGIAGDMLWVAMEYCDQGELDDRLERERGMTDIRQRNEWVSQLAHGLQHMHGLRILHRDISAGKSWIAFLCAPIITRCLSSDHRISPETENILIDSGENGRMAAKYINFGLAIELNNDAPADHGVPRATQKYMAPEMESGDNYSFSADVWSLALVIVQVRDLIMDSVTKSRLLCSQMYTGRKEIDGPLVKERKTCKGSQSSNYHFPKLDTFAIDVLDRIVVSNPANRPTASNLVALVAVEFCGA